MELKATFLLLILVTVTRARPNDNDYNDLDDEPQCSDFEDKQKFPDDPKLNFRFDYFFKISLLVSRFHSEEKLKHSKSIAICCVPSISFYYNF